MLYSFEMYSSLGRLQWLTNSKLLTTNDDDETALLYLDVTGNDLNYLYFCFFFAAKNDVLDKRTSFVAFVKHV